VTDVSKKLAIFLQWAMQVGPWDGCDLDGASIQDKAQELGLIVEEKFDPDKHGCHHGYAFDYGDPFFTLSPDVKAALSPAERS